MRALVIGVSGLVGGALRRALEGAGIEAIGTHCSRPLYGSVKLDVRSADAVNACLDSIKPNIILLAVNMPGGVDYCEDHPDKAYALSVQGTRHVVEAAQRWGAKIVYYSTDYIFDGKLGPYSEEDEPCPLSACKEIK